MAHLDYAVSTASGPRQWCCVSRFGFDDTLVRLKQGIAALDLWLIHEIDPQMLAARDGLAIGQARQLLFFHPRLLKQVLLGDARALPEVPLKIVAVERPDGTVVLRGPDPLQVFGQYPSLGPLAGTLAACLGEILARVTGDT